eukprot:m.28478 g.28478  ORF g.28478 m.28478 type:complete len:224 (+) comp11845_c0_seq2:74-745(+)
MPRQQRPPPKKNKSTRSKIRDVQRLLRKEDLPETMRVSQERALKALTQQLGDEQQSHRERKMQAKYKMVKFMERRKIMRKQAALQKRLNNPELSPQAKLELQAEIEQRQSWLDYIEFFPRDAKYISILKPSADISAGALATRGMVWFSPACLASCHLIGAASSTSSSVLCDASLVGIPFSLSLASAVDLLCRGDAERSCAEDSFGRICPGTRTICPAQAVRPA